MHQPVTADYSDQDRRRRNIWLGLLTLFHLALIGFSELKFEEAYYWNYSQHPALSYFDHPPMVAWAIGISCAIFGWKSWAVKLPAVLFYSASCWILSEISGRIFHARAALWTLALLASVPALALYSTFILPDSPLIFFWSLGLWAGYKLFESEDTRWWWLIGVATGFGLDSKYSALLIPLGAFIQALWIGRPQLAFNGRMLAAAALAIELFSPVILWNVSTDFASFKFQGSERMAQATSLGERLGGWGIQMALLSPALFLMVPSCLIWSYRSRQENKGHRLLLSYVLPFLVLMVYVSLRRLVQMNWPLPAYVGLICLMAGYLSERSWGKWVVVQALLLRLVTAIVIVFPVSLANKIDDIHQWSEFGTKALELRTTMPRPERTFFAAPGYQSASELAFSTGQPHLTLSNNLFGERALGYDFWEPPSEFRGWDCIVANYAHPDRQPDGLHWKERNPLNPEHLSRHFDTVEEPISVVIERAGRPLRRYQFFRCYNYRPHGRLKPNPRKE